MSLSGILVQMLNGLASASTLFLLASGLSLIFGVTRIVNFAHGSLFMLGAYIAWSLTERMSGALSSGERIEIRGFGSFSLHYRPPRIGRNPKTGESVSLAGKHVPHFKPGKELRDRVNQASQELQGPSDQEK